MEFNIVAFAYLFLRLAPFILICFFTLSSIFNQDFKGLIYLLGILFSSILCISAGSLFEKDTTDKNAICTSLTVSKADILSRIPLGQNIIVFTMTYLIYSMMVYNIVPQNWPTIVFFVLLSSFNFYWNLMYKCHDWKALLAATALGFSGMFWGFLINEGFKSKRLLYFTGIEQSNHCSRPTKQTFKCKVYKNGSLISG
jgi:hypothetical protein